ncbi:MAG: type II secretion system protein [Candidatus Omnitrophica bacterium]|nr:type II secretion system protein [Candidatus Omnitrophota bacterium]
MPVKSYTSLCEGANLKKPENMVNFFLYERMRHILNNVRRIVANGKGFSLMEMIVVLVILSISITITLKWQTTFMEKNRSRKAENNLAVIFNAEKRYKLDNGEYYGCDNSCVVKEQGITKIKALHVVLDDRFFTYSIVTENNGASFMAIATRNTEGKSICTGKRMEVSSESSLVIKDDSQGCIVWR